MRDALTIFGLGYVGLPLSLSYSMKGYKVYGIDISDKLVNQLKRGESHLHESYQDKSIEQILQESIESGCFIPSTDPSAAFLESNKYLVTVGIPTSKDSLNYQYLTAACETISHGLKAGDTVVIRSTVVPGTTEEKLIPLLEKSGLKAGKDFHLVYCPERISEGNAFDEFENIPVVISGINAESVQAGIKIIRMISKVEPMVVSSIKMAETAKVVENIQRDVNIAMVHQFSDFCRKLNINVFELIKAVNTHPRVNLLKPGPGVGGYCIPNALHYLKPKALEIGSSTALLGLSRNINESVPRRIAEEVKQQLEKRDTDPSRIKIAVLGVAMKDFCSDDRQSPVLDIIRQLIDYGFSVKAYDPCVKNPYPCKSLSLHEALHEADGILICALQEGIDYNDFKFIKSLVKDSAIIFDTRNIIDQTAAQAYGFTVASLL